MRLAKSSLITMVYSMLLGLPATAGAQNTWIKAAAGDELLQTYGETEVCDQVLGYCIPIEDFDPPVFHDFARDSDFTSPHYGEYFIVGNRSNGHGNILRLDDTGDMAQSDARWFVPQDSTRRLTDYRTEVVLCCENERAVSLSIGTLVRKSDSADLGTWIGVTTHESSDLDIISTEFIGPTNLSPKAIYAKYTEDGDVILGSTWSLSGHTMMFLSRYVFDTGVYTRDVTGYGMYGLNFVHARRTTGTA